DKAKIQINKKSTNPASHDIQYSVKDVDVVFTPGGGATDDPVANGAEAVVFSATDCQCMTLAPAPTVIPGWTRSPSAGTPTKYKWKDAATHSAAQVKAKLIKFKKKGGITYGLDTTPQGRVEIQMRFGSSASKFCTQFPPPIANNDTPTKYKATVGPAPCPFVTKWGSAGSGDAQFEFPWGVAVDGSGNVYVADRDNNGIQKFDANGAFLTKWGNTGGS